MYVIGIADMSILAKQGYIGTKDLISPVKTEQLSVVKATYRRLRPYFLGLEHTIRIFNMTTGEVYDLPCLLSYDIDEFIETLEDKEAICRLASSQPDPSDYWYDDIDIDEDIALAYANNAWDDFEDDWD